MKTIKISADAERQPSKLKYDDKLKHTIKQIDSERSKKKQKQSDNERPERKKQLDRRKPNKKQKQRDNRRPEKKATRKPKSQVSVSAVPDAR